MSPRNTSTGNVLEHSILPALRRGGYTVRTQTPIGLRLGGKGKHLVDALAEKEGRTFLVSSKWQQTSGTAEQKVPYEVLCLVQAMNDSLDEFAGAYLVLGGDGWSLRDFYTSGGLESFMPAAKHVRIVTLERFIALANSGKL